MRLRHDKSRYDPGETAIFTVVGLPKDHKSVQAIVTIYHLHQVVAVFLPIFLETDEEEYRFIWKTPPTDFCGYLIELELRITEGRSETLYTAVDVSSDWRRFPRYGYLTDFSTGVDTTAIIDEMVDWQLNSIEYYDWKFLHHQPLPEDHRMEWEDWSGRPISGATVKSYIREAKKRHIINMSYNMIYAATNNYADYGVKEEWGLWYAGGAGNKDRTVGERFVFKMGHSPSGQDRLYFFDIENPQWQDFIIEKNLEALDEMGFDGWHGDTVGEWGPMWTKETMGKPEKAKLVKDGYHAFLNLAKERMGEQTFLSFNPVGAQGIEQVNTSAVDMLYAEIWPWDIDRDGEGYETYGALKKVVDRARAESGGKSLVIPAYMEYERANRVTNEPFNMAAELLTDAAVYAAGGSRIELGDGHQMLSSEYFPSKNLYMNGLHQEKQLALQNFIVAYENILRDGLEDDDKQITVGELPVSKTGCPNMIWAYSKSSETCQSVQLINLLGVSSNDWRAAEGIKETPIHQQNLPLKLYSDTVFRSGWFITPDQLQSPQKLSIEYGTDNKGNYAAVRVPSLEYWSVVYFEK